MNSFCTTSSKIKLMIAISAFGLGVDIPDVRRVLIGGFQVTWRSMYRRQGMLDEMACLLIAILHEGKSGRYVNKEMKAYVSNKEICRRKLLFNFNLYFENDVCDMTCDCSDCSIKVKGALSHFRILLSIPLIILNNFQVIQVLAAK